MDVRLAGDLLQEQHVGAVEHGQVDRRAGGGEQVGQRGPGDRAQHRRSRYPLAELEHPQAELVAVAAALQQAPLDQLLRQAVRRRLRHAGPAAQVGQSQLVGAGFERAEQQLRLAEHRTGPAFVLGGHGTSSRLWIITTRKDPSPADVTVRYQRVSGRSRRETVW
ncbi:hypothetical protein ABFJ78_46585 [Amycolatopsis sp. MEPSY49]